MPPSRRSYHIKPRSFSLEIDLFQFVARLVVAQFLILHADLRARRDGLRDEGIAADDRPPADDGLAAEDRGWRFLSFRERPPFVESAPKVTP